MGGTASRGDFIATGDVGDFAAVGDLTTVGAAGDAGDLVIAWAGGDLAMTRWAGVWWGDTAVRGAGMGVPGSDSRFNGDLLISLIAKILYVNCVHANLQLACQLAGVLPV